MLYDHKPNEGACIQAVRTSGQVAHWHQCRNRIRKDKYCLQHHPDTRAQRKKVNDQKYRLQIQKRQKPMRDLKAFREALVFIADGISNPRQVASTALKRADDD